MKIDRFCASCGRKMKQIITPLNKFDTWSGQRHVFMTYRCVNKRWYKLGHHDLDRYLEVQEKANEEN